MTYTLTPEGKGGIVLRWNGSARGGSEKLNYQAYRVTGDGTVWAHRDGTEYRLDTVYIYSDGTIATWSARQTKTGHDYKNGIGINESIEWFAEWNSAVAEMLIMAAADVATDIDTYRCELCGNPVHILDQQGHMNLNHSQQEDDMPRTTWSMTSTTPELDHGDFDGNRAEAVAEAKRLGREGHGVDDGDTVKVYTQPSDTRVTH